jgi:hypothetical protein
MYQLDKSFASARTQARLADRIMAARDRLRDEGIASLPDVMTGFAAEIETDQEQVGPAILAGVKAVLDAFAADHRSVTAYAAVAGVDRAAASAMANAMVELVLSSMPDLSTLADAHFIGLVALLSAAGEHERAAILLGECEIDRTSAGVRHAAWLARCRWAGCARGIGNYWPDTHPGASEAEARAQIDRQPLAIEAHRALARHLLDHDEPVQALNALAVALALPIGDADKADLAIELAMTTAMLFVRGERRALDAGRIQWALAGAGSVAARAAELLGEWIATEALPFTDTEEVDLMQRRLRVAARSGNIVAAQAAGETPVTAFPMRNGKPHVQTVWLEITNYCNQKCTFCPDMFREDARTWLPLDKIKSLIDELADTISVGSMQLNAYGEPLLHPNFDEILSHIRARNLPWPTFFTSHGLTLVDKKLKQLSNNYPAGIAISLHNDSQASYAATRSAKIGDYATMVERVSALMRQMAAERAPTHLRLYQMVSNAHVDMRVAAETRAAFPDTAERMIAHVRKWERIAADIAAAHSPDFVQACVSSMEDITRAFEGSDRGDSQQLPILVWLDVNGQRQTAFMSARPANTYANLLLEYDPSWDVERKLINPQGCHFTPRPSLAIYATGRLGICCLDLNSTATFGSLSDFGSLREALTSTPALQMFAQISNGVATSRGCQICLGSTKRTCGGD